MLTIKTLSVSTLILMSIANVSTVIASQDNKDGNTNMSDTLKLSDSLSLSNSFASDIDSNSDANANNEIEPSSNIIASNVQHDPFDCDESIIESKSEEDFSSEDHSLGEMINAIDGHQHNTGAGD